MATRAQESYANYREGNMLEIDPKYVSLIDLLRGRLFAIPQYQRAYSWRSEHRKDLFHDIDRTYDKGSDAVHYMATAVCFRHKEKKKIGTDVYESMDVVDGQQRITTLILMLKALQLELSEDGGNEEKLKGELSELLVKPEGDEPLLMQTNHDNRKYFSSWLRNGDSPPSEEATTISDRELLCAVEESTAYIRRWRERGKLLDLGALLKNQLYFLLHTVGDEGTVYTVFEVLNSRGLVVAWLDRLKSALMGKAYELEGVNTQRIIKDLHESWATIYDTIGLDEKLGTEALQFAATLYADEMPSRPLGEENAVKDLSAIAIGAETILEVARWVEKVSKACKEFIEDKRLEGVTAVKQARLLAVAIHLRSDLNKDEKSELLVLWEKVVFRIYGMYRRDARTGVGDFVRLAWRTAKDGIGREQIRDDLKQICSAFPLDKAIELMKGKDCYPSWSEEVRYFMMRYEEFLWRDKGLKYSSESWNKIWDNSPSKSIEHVWPQSKAPEQEMHRLGNLILLPPGWNSRLKDKDCEKKTEEYRHTGLMMAAKVADVIDSKGWGEEQIEERENMLLDWARQEWSMEGS